jgi:hypothetical protein
MKNINLTKTQLLNRLKIYEEILTNEIAREKRVMKGTLKRILKEQILDLTKEIAEIRQQITIKENFSKTLTNQNRLY